MNKNSVIYIVNHQSIFSQNDKIEYIVPGRYIKKNGKYYIVYKEYKDNALNNLGDICCIKVENCNLVTITRHGRHYKSKLILEKEERHCNQYITPYGAINMGVYTHSVKHNLKETVGEIYLKYFIDVDSSLICENEVYIKVKENA